MLKNKAFRRENDQEIINEIWNYPLTLVTAPMGYGKTYSMEHFIQEKKVEVLSIRLMESEKVEVYLWKQLMEWLGDRIPEQKERLAQIDIPQDAIELVEVLDCFEKMSWEGIILIDNYHHVGMRRQVTRFIEELAMRQIVGLHIVLMAQTIPDMNVEELRIKKICYLIDRNKLIFTREDLTNYFEFHEVSIEEKELEALYQYTEGWAAAIYLAMKSIQEHGKANITPNVNKILENKVYSQYREDVQRAMVYLSLMDNFSIEQLDYVFEGYESSILINNLCARNAFIIYDVKDDKYRLHNIFREFLRKKIKFMPQEEIKKIYRRIGSWYIDQKECYLGIEYLARVQDYHKILESLSAPRFRDNPIQNIKGVKEVYESIPKEILREYPIAYLVYIYICILEGDEIKGINELKAYEIYYKGHHYEDEQANRRILGEIALANAYINDNNVREMLFNIQKAYEHLPQGSKLIKRSTSITFGLPSLSWRYFKEEGSYKEDVLQMKKDFQYHRKVTDGCGTGIEEILEAEWQFEIGRIKKAEVLVQKGICRAEMMEQYSVVLSGYFLMIRILLVQKSDQKAIELLKKLEQEEWVGANQIMIDLVEMEKAYLYIRLQRLDQVPESFKKSDKINSKVQGKGIEGLIRVKVLIESGQFIQAEVQCEHLIEKFKEKKKHYGYIYARILQVICKIRLQEEEAKKILEQVLREGYKDQITMLFVEYSTVLGPMLTYIQNELEATDPIHKYIQHILDIAKKNRQEERGVDKISSSFRKYGLTKREGEILEKIVEGLTNKQIASELYLAQITVGKTVTSIYQKMKVGGRREAIDLFRENTMQLNFN